MKPTIAILPVFTSVLLSACAVTSAPPANLDRETADAISAMSEKLAAARTIRVTARRTASPGFFPDNQLAGEARIRATVRRPDGLRTELDTNLGRRTVVYNGKQLLLVDHGAGTHATSTAPPNLDAAVRSWHETYGFLPPLAELLVNRPESFLLNGVSEGVYKGATTVNGKRAGEFAFRQADFTWTLWISPETSLPVRIESVYPNGEGGAPLKFTVTIEEWELNPPVSASSFDIREPAGSRAIDIIPLAP